MEIKNAAAMGRCQHPTACVRVKQALVHSGISPHRNVYYSVFPRFLQAEKALSFVVFAFCRL